METRRAEHKDITKKIFPDIKWETQKLYDRLKSVAIGETITYKELSLAIDRENIQNECRWFLDSARKKLQSEEKILFGVKATIGLVRLDNAGVIDCGDIAIKKVRRAAKRGIKKLICIDFNSLTNKDKTKLIARQGALGAVSMFTRKKTIKGIGDMVDDKEPKFLTYKPDLSQFR